MQYKYILGAGWSIQNNLIHDFSKYVRNKRNPVLIHSPTHTPRILHLLPVVLPFPSQTAAAAVVFEEHDQLTVQQAVAQSVDERVHHTRRLGKHRREDVPVGVLRERGDKAWN